MEFSPKIKQFLVALSTFLAAFSVGGAVTYPTLLMEHYRSTVDLDVGTKSWLGSVYGLAEIPAIVLPIISQSIGRKLGYIITCVCLAIGWILAYTANNITELLISEFFHGLGTYSLTPVCFLGLSEMLAPKYRVIAMQTYTLVEIVGMASCGIMGRFLRYDTLGIVMLGPILIAIVMALLWPESPSWLAYKGEFKKCKVMFVRLRGDDDESIIELNNLISAQRENLTHSRSYRAKTVESFWRNITRRDFYMPAFHIFILMTMMHWGGCDVIYIYFIELLAKSTDDSSSIFYASIVMYLIIIVGALITNVTLAKCKNKTVLLSSTMGILLFLSCACIISILQKFSLLASNASLMIYCLLAFEACSSLGISELVFIISSELLPVKHRNFGGSLYIIFNCILYASAMKLAPYLFLYLGTLGTFLIYIVSTTSCALYLWRYLPETKGKSLQEIEDFYTHGHFVKRLCENTLTPMNNNNL